MTASRLAAGSVTTGFTEAEVGTPFISVIVPVRNEAAHIAHTLSELLNQRYPAERFEVLVVDGESTDATPSIVTSLAERHANVRLLANPRRWSSAGRNVGIRNAQGEIIVVVDGHCELANANHLREIADAFARSEADCLGRPQPLDVSRANPLQRAIAAARNSRLGHHPDSFIYSADERFVPPQSVAVAYRRSAFDEVGMFDERFDACEDVEFNHRVARAGLRCYFTPRIAVHYVPRATLSGLFRQMIRYGRGRVRLLRKHRETFSLACFIPAIFVLAWIAGPLLALLHPLLAVPFLAALSLYLFAQAAAIAVIGRREHDTHVLAWLPLVFFAIHCGAGVGILREWLTRAPRPPESDRALVWHSRHA
jgi:succinoglycan biosynthesis protein ExoA